MRVSPVLRLGQTRTSGIFIYDAPKSLCDSCPVAQSGGCNGRQSTKALLKAPREMDEKEWNAYVREINAACKPGIERF